MNNLIKPAFQIGMTAMKVVVEIVRINPKISNLGFCRYVPHYNVKESWEKPLLPLSLLHDPTIETIKLKREEATTENLKRIVDSLEEDTVIGVISRVRVENEIRHIPLMDFSCRCSDTSLKKIRYFLKKTEQKRGVILSSGRSYHYYGANLMNGEEWVNFLGDCGPSGLADERYLFHRFKDQCGILRLSSCPLRSTIPTVISILE